MGWTGTRPRTNIGMIYRRGVNAVVNGDFAVDTNWAKGDGWTINDVTPGKAHCDGSQAAGTILAQTNVFIVNNLFEITFTLSGRTAGEVRTYAGTSGAMTWRNSDDTYTEQKVATGTPSLLIVGNPDFIGDVDDVSAVQLSLS